RDLERDGGDRARVLVARLDEVRRGPGEERPHTAHRVRCRVEPGRDELLVERAGDADGVSPELLLATGKEVVERTEGRLGLRDDLLHARRRVALAAKQLGARGDDALAGAGCGHIG